MFAFYFNYLLVYMGRYMPRQPPRASSFRKEASYFFTPQLWRSRCSGSLGKTLACRTCWCPSRRRFVSTGCRLRGGGKLRATTPCSRSFLGENLAREDIFTVIINDAVFQKTNPTFTVLLVIKFVRNSRRRT